MEIAVVAVFAPTGFFLVKPSGRRQKSLLRKSGLGGRCQNLFLSFVDVSDMFYLSAGGQKIERQRGGRWWGRGGCRFLLKLEKGGIRGGRGRGGPGAFLSGPKFPCKGR